MIIYFLADVNKQSKNLATPLQTLVTSNLFMQNNVYEKKFSETFDVLMNRKANCNAKDENGKSILHHAVKSQNLLAVSHLVKLKEIDISVNFI